MTTDSPQRPGLSYKTAGVDVEVGNRLVPRIAEAARRTWRDRHGVLGDIGGFGSLLAVPRGYREPVLVSGADGVGTKLLLARALDRHDSIGIDLVAMCANDILTTGAEPLQFLDYFATGVLDEQHAAQVIEGIARGCELAGCALVGGETAEMPGLYSPGDYDLAGFCLGIVERSAIITGSTVEPGFALIGLASSGVHSNGYSLVRKLLELTGADLSAPMDGRSLGEVLLEPTRIYVRPVLKLVRALPVAAAAHITGGGLPENLPRALPAGLGARIDLAAFPRPAIFHWLQEKGGIDDREMLHTFNCGLGMVLCVAPADESRALTLLAAGGETPHRIGEVIEVDNDPRVLFEGTPGQ